MNLSDRLLAALPQTQCTRCGYPDCRSYAQAMAEGLADINRCPPGGAEGIQRLSAITGRPAPLDARISYLSPSPEYTPPILYNRENRSKLVFMVEAVFNDATAARDLHPGQPVDVLK